MVVATLILLRPDWLDWYGGHAWVSLQTMHQLEPGTRLNLLAVIPQSDGAINTLFWFFLASAVMLAFGFLTRLNNIFVFLCLTSIQQRNLYMLHGGDTFLRVAGFFLIFAPAGAALSIDRLIRIRRGKESAEIQPRSPWAQRMIQFELALMYFITFWWKTNGVNWVNGTAVYYIIHLDEVQRFPIPILFQNPVVVKLATWLGLAVEFSLGVLIWFKEIRYVILLLGLLFHLSLEYWLNVPLFQWDILSAYVLFVDPRDLERVWGWIRLHVSKQFGRVGQRSQEERLPHGNFGKQQIVNKP